MELAIVLLTGASLCFATAAFSFLLQLEDEKRLKNKHMNVYHGNVNKMKEEIKKKQDHLDAIEILLNLEE